jgi:predicted DNA-binding antitoxin AbrB/MazE fold protein
MVQQVEAVYEHGVLRPLKPLSLTELQRVRIIISDTASGISQRDMKIVEKAQAEIAALENAPTIEEVRTALAAIPGSLSHDVIADRGDY